MPPRGSAARSRDRPAGLGPQCLDRRLAGLADLGRDVLGDGVADDADPQSAGVACLQPFAEQGRAEQAAVGGVGAERAGDDQRGYRRHVMPLHRRAAEGRLQPGEATVGGGEADRAEPVGADRAGDEACAAAAAGPLEEPPGQRSVFQGLRAGP